MVACVWGIFISVILGLPTMFPIAKVGKPHHCRAQLSCPAPPPPQYSHIFTRTYTERETHTESLAPIPHPTTPPLQDNLN